MRTWEKIHPATVDDPVVREYLHRIDRFLEQLDSAVGNIQTILNITGSEREGDVVVIPTVHDGSPIISTTEGILAFGGTDVAGVAHPLVVNTDGELMLGHLPGVTEQDLGTFPLGGYAANQAFPLYMSEIFAHGRGRREINGPFSDGTGSAYFAQTDDSGFNVGFTPSIGAQEAAAEQDHALLAQVVPKVYPRLFTEFAGAYGNGGVTTVAMSTGNRDTNARLTAWRFNKVSISFTTGITGAPTQEMVVQLLGSATDGAPLILIREWAFDADDWTDGFGTKDLVEDIHFPFIAITLSSGNNGGGNAYDVANFYVTLFS